ncbi:hypothetical protein HYW21_05260 [Candidatus Woesearchaeota archaeon]|nr:hypothetical protein [Candidatus Woesearchaeota archaeon]
MSIKFPATVELEVDNLPERFQLAFNVCYNPDCDCNGVNMVLYNENKEVHFLKSEENSSLNLKFFKENYFYVKEKVKSKKGAVDSFELGTLMPYREIIWTEADPELKIDGINCCLDKDIKQFGKAVKVSY